jgi:hypothetical protein
MKKEDIIAFGDALKTFGYGLGEMLATIPTPITLYTFQLTVGTHMGTAACTTGNYTVGCNF